MGKNMDDLAFAKAHFDLKPCPNTLYEFVLLGRLFHIQFAKELWSELDSKLCLNKYFIKIASVESQDGIKINRIIFWKLSITWGKLL